MFLGYDPHPSGGVALNSIFGSHLESGLVFAARFGGHTRMKSADSLDVVAARDLIRTRRRRPKGRNCDSASRLRLHTQKITKNDRCGWERLSKIAHK